MSDIYKAPEAQLHDPSQPGEFGSMETALSGKYELKPVELIKNAWAKLPGMKAPFWIAGIVYFVISMVFSVLQRILAGDPAQGDVNWVLYILISLAQMAVVMPMAAGMFLIGLKHSVDARMEWGEIFKHFDKTLNLFLCGLLMYLLIGLGLVLLVIPGLYLMVAFAMAIPLVVEKNMGPWDALMTSRKAVHHKWFNMLGFFGMTILVFLAGMLALFVGLIWAYPLVILAYAMIYRDMFGVEEKTLNGA